MSFQSIRIRFGRSVITTSGILLAIAFVMAIFTSAAIQEVLPEKESSPEREESGFTDEQKWLISLSLLVCVVGITNAMLMSVSERYREIGTMKCLGALDGFVVRLFVIESAFQGMIGATGGVILGVLGMSIALLTKHHGKEIAYPWMAILLRATISIGIGMILSIIGAIYPAYRAAKMAPAEAMRRE